MGNSSERRQKDRSPERRLKGRVLSALAVSLVLLLSLGIYAIDQIHRQHVIEKIEDTMQGAMSLYKQSLESDARQLAALLESITDDRALMADLVRRDRATLLEKNQALFKILKEQYQITHFYFSGADRVNIVRIHNPPRFGDTINRHTTLEAERSGKLFYGIELGKFGMFTLRVVKPVFEGNRLIGFVELGREIEHIIQNISKTLRVDLYVTLYKTKLNRETWEEGMRLMGRTPHWDRFPELLLIEATGEPSENDLLVFSNTNLKSHEDDYSFEAGKERQEVSIFTLAAPLFDVSGDEVGDLWVHMDFTNVAELAYDHIRRLSMVGVGVVVLLLGFLYLILGRVQQAVHDFREQSLEASREREDAKQHHLDQMTAKKKEVEELAERMVTIVDTAMDGIVTIDANGNVLSFNQAASAIFGYSEEEMLGQNINQLMPEPHRSQHNGYLKQYLEGGERHIIGSGRELVGLHKSGREIPVHLAISEVRLHGERSFTGVIHDISDRKRAEAAMRQRNEALEISNRELQDFAYVASHDLQEPLRKIRAFGDRLQSRIGDQVGERGRDYLERMLNAAERMQVLISSLLSYSRVTTQAKPFEPVNLGDIVTGVVSDLEARIEETGARVVTQDLPVLDADNLQMRQLFQNLIGNALKFQRHGTPPVVQISARPLDPSEGRGGLRTALWEITIEDNGIGFDEKYAQRIFEVFERLHHRSNYEGTGIGLAVCRKIVERHDGVIRAQGKPDEGAVFTIILPERHETKMEDPE